jgi:hypothetical protein
MRGVWHGPVVAILLARRPDETTSIFGSFQSLIVVRSVAVRLE